MLVVFGVVASVVSPETFAENAVEVFSFIDLFIFPHNYHIGFDKMFFEAGGLPVKTFDHFCVILSEHGRDGIPFG